MQSDGMMRLMRPRGWLIAGRNILGVSRMAAVIRALVFIATGVLVITVGDALWQSCQAGSWKQLLGQASSSSCVEFWLNRYQTLLAALAALLAAWITVNAIRHQTETARVDEAERALNEYEVASLEVMQNTRPSPLPSA